MIVKNDKPLMAISYDTRTFLMLKRFMHDSEPDLELLRIDPKEFILTSSNEFQYINLITKDFDERKLISKLLDDRSHDRFSYIDTEYKAVKHEHSKFGPGCFIYPGVMTYFADFGKDVMVHGRCNFAEGVTVGDGCFFSGTVTVAGDSSIGSFCNISTNVLIMDHVSICDNVRILPATNVRKSITKPGTYYNPYAYKVEEINLR